VTSTPRHIAIIMDGNGRWAAARGVPRAEGHRRGAEAARAAVTAAIELGVKYLTLFSFSSENWNRPEPEIRDLMNLLRLYLKKETAELHKSGARLLIIGNRARLPEDIVKLIESAESLTKDNAKTTVVIALSYGGREDVLFAAKEIARRAKQGTLDPEGLTEQDFAPFLMTAGIPDPDLMIRTSGESRISNFLMWQLAYAELFFTDTLWPDFSKKDMEAAIAFYASRERRYGARPQEAERG
jgi:undecaprenyl diphosphate synthase